MSASPARKVRQSPRVPARNGMNKARHSPQVAKVSRAFRSPRFDKLRDE